jgi:E3 ubiquitin-protein ligase HECTD3
VVSLVEGGAEKLVAYDDRLEYCRLVKDRRMKESTKQVNALRRGFTKVVPPAVLRLLTWQELEVKVCGNPEISVEKLKMSARYEGGLTAKSKRVEQMWQAVEKFTNEERSRLLRFITGRRRLPCTIYIDSGDGEGKLPTSATCSNTLYLPKYESVDEAVDRLRYAAYNCVAIDTDMTVWE